LVLFKKRPPPTFRSGGNDVIGVSNKKISPPTLRPDGSDVILVLLKVRLPSTLKPGGSDAIGVPDNSRSPLPPSYTYCWTFFWVAMR
jgi:hypothetical protein